MGWGGATESLLCFRVLRDARESAIDTYGLRRFDWRLRRVGFRRRVHRYILQGSEACGEPRRRREGRTLRPHERSTRFDDARLPAEFQTDEVGPASARLSHLFLSKQHKFFVGDE
jgi:hypothetical protein